MRDEVERPPARRLREVAVEGLPEEAAVSPEESRVFELFAAVLERGGVQAKCGKGGESPFLYFTGFEHYL